MCQSTRTPSPYPISVFTEIPSLQRFLHECVLSKRFARASASMTNLVNFCDMLESFLAPDTHMGQVSLSLSLSLSLVSVSVSVCVSISLSVSVTVTVSSSAPIVRFLKCYGSSANENPTYVFCTQNSKCRGLWIRERCVREQSLATSRLSVSSSMSTYACAHIRESAPYQYMQPSV